MTTSVRNPVTPPPSTWQRLVQLWQTLFAPGDLTTLLITIALLIVPALALQSSEWPLEMRVIIPTAILSVLFGFLLARSRYNELLALALSIGYGSVFVILFAASLTEGGTYAVMSRTINWIFDAFTGGINTDEMVFTLLVGILFWFLGYNAAWHVFRIDRVWRVILPPGLIIVTNTVFFQRPGELQIHIAAFFFLALLLIARSNLDAREWEWYANGIRIPPRLRVQFLRVGAVLALLSLGIAWITPTGNLQQQLDSFQEFLRSEPLTQLNEFWNRLFAPIESNGPTSADYYGGDSLSLRGAIRLGEQEVFYVSAPQGYRYYWRSRIFETYELGRWDPAADKRLTTYDVPFSIITSPDASRVQITQDYTIALRSSRLVYTAPQPLDVNLATVTDLSYTADEGSPNRYMNISAIRPDQVLERGDQYTANSLISVATADELRNAGTNYPEWISRHPQYLRSTPNVIGDRTIALTFQIINESGATNNYDKAKAIETWLRANITYNETIPEPPPGADPIEWFLFDIQEGYCNYYATAMIVMLRTIGIPARMGAGFAQGTWDPAQNAYVVRERDAHTWVEAYFPGYGWIEFEPTSAQAPLAREGDQAVSQNFVNPLQPSETPTFTASPLPPTPTFEPTATDANGESNPPELQASPTITPTFTPSPTATPVILPTQPAPVQPEPRDPLSLLLSALGLGLLGVVAIMLVVAVVTFIYWWWEWRGMRGLSPITRAYARLERYLKLLGVAFTPQQTPEERRRRIMRDLPGAERPVTAITRMYMTERYGPDQSASGAQRGETADRAWRDARRNILSRWLGRLRFWRRD